ncbi:MAG: hypothetical protein ACREBE_07275 [bacterium]
MEIVRVLRAAKKTMLQADLSRECRFASDTVRETVADLSRTGVVEIDAAGTVQLSPLTRDAAFETLMAIYDDDRPFVLSELSTIAMGRIRNMAARAFANAFVLRKKRGDGDG